MERIELKKLLFFSFLAIIAVMGLSAYLASLVIPNWDVFILYPFWHSFFAWAAFTIIAFLIVLILYSLVDLAIDKQVLERENDDLKNKVTMFETELNRLKKRE